MRGLSRFFGCRRPSRARAAGAGGTGRAGQLGRDPLAWDARLIALEPRFMFDAAGAVEALDQADQDEPEKAARGGANAAADRDGAADAETLAILDALAQTGPGDARRTVAVIDAAVPDRDALRAELDRDTQVILLDGDRNGVRQIANALAGREGIQALHIYARSSDGQLYLGDTVLTDRTIQAEAGPLRAIGAALAADGEILLHGCAVGRTPAGQGLVDVLASATGAEVSVLTDDTEGDLCREEGDDTARGDNGRDDNGRDGGDSGRADRTGRDSDDDGDSPPSDSDRTAEGTDTRTDSRRSGSDASTDGGVAGTSALDLPGADNKGVTPAILGADALVADRSKHPATPADAHPEDMAGGRGSESDKAGGGADFGPGGKGTGPETGRGDGGAAPDSRSNPGADARRSADPVTTLLGQDTPASMLELRRQLDRVNRSGNANGPDGQSPGNQPPPPREVAPAPPGPTAPALAGAVDGSAGGGVGNPVIVGTGGNSGVGPTATSGARIGADDGSALTAALASAEARGTGDGATSDASASSGATETADTGGSRQTDADGSPGFGGDSAVSFLGTLSQAIDALDIPVEQREGLAWVVQRDDASRQIALQTLQNASVFGQVTTRDILDGVRALHLEGGPASALIDLYYRALKASRSEAFAGALGEIQSEGVSNPFAAFVGVDVTDTSFLPPITKTKVALLIGINDYGNGIPDLVTPLNDVNELGRTLEQSYGYQSIVLSNPTQAEIVQALATLAQVLTEQHSLLVFYAGQGYLMEETDIGYWLPADAEAESARHWLSTADLSLFLREIRAGQTLVISDSCYSGAFTSELSVTGDRAAVAPAAAADPPGRAVLVMSSGGEEPVRDDGPGGHSVFAAQLLASLREGGDARTGFQIFADVKDKVTLVTYQAPEYGAILAAGHQPGTPFVLR